MDDFLLTGRIFSSDRCPSYLSPPTICLLAMTGLMMARSQNNAFLIMDALQFQDITSQQMHHASTLLEDIEGRLQHLLSVFDGEAMPEFEDSEAKKERAFDPDADLFDGKNQSEVDTIVSQVADKS